MHARNVPYTTVYRGALFSVPAVPAWQCDICAYLEYDEDVMARMEALVGETLLPHEAAETESKLPPFEADGEREPGDKKSRTRVKP